MNGGLLLDVVVSESTGLIELLSRKDQALLVGGDAFAALDLLLDALDGIVGLNIECDGLSSEGADEDLLGAAAEAEDQVEGSLLGNVVISKGALPIELLASENETLLVGRDSLALLNLGLDSLDSVGSLDIDSDGLAG